MHMRTAIRLAAAEAAKGLATTNQRVYASRFWPLTPANLPAWVVSTDGEEAAERVTMGEVERQLPLTFTGIARAANGAELELLLDMMALELEEAIAVAPLPLVDDLELRFTRYDFQLDDADQAIGTVELEYLAVYTVAGAPIAPADDDDDDDDGG